MKAFDINITIGTIADNEDMAMDSVSEILYYIQKELPMDNYKIEIKEVGEYL